MFSSKKIVLCLAISSFFLSEARQVKYDMTIVGKVDFKDGRSRTAYYIINQLAADLSIAHYHAGLLDKHNKYCEDPYGIQNSFSTTDNLDDARMYLDTRSVFHISEWPRCQSIHKDAVRCAYSVWESTALPARAAKELNTFDAIVVADSYLVDVYKNSGVTVPVFHIPHILYLERFLKEPAKTKKNDPLTFGCVANTFGQKNLQKLIMAFYEQYGNNPEFLLKLHCKDLDDNLSSINIDSFVDDSFKDLAVREEVADVVEEETVTDLIDRLEVSNIVISTEVMSEQEYIAFFKTIDCYVLLSKGEGFSITPREALALGIPCILTDNTAHTTICKSGCVLPVACYPVQAWDNEFNQAVGTKFDCDVSDITAAMQEMVTKYDIYLEKAQQGRQWVKQYLAPALKPQYSTFFAPAHVVLSDVNKVDPATQTLYTNDFNFYEKMKNLIEKKHHVS